MNIEDLIFIMAQHRLPGVNNWDYSMMTSFSEQISNGNSLTERQADVAVKILKRHNSVLCQFFNKDIGQFIENPTFRHDFRRLNKQRKISIVKNLDWGKVIKVEFPFQESYIEQIKKNRDKFFLAQWDRDERAWFFSLEESSIRFLLNFFNEYEVEWDEEFKSYQEQVKKIYDEVEKHIPMLVYENNDLKFVNIPENLPKLQSKDIISAIFEARKKGIFTWDSKIDNFLSNCDLNRITLNLIKNVPGTSLHIDAQETSILELKDIVRYLNPCMFIIPGVNELDKVQMAYELLKHAGINNEEISVMFRLSSEVNKNFNNFVREYNLNNPISEKTKVVFVSRKLPKPVVKSNIAFNCIINLGYDNVHYTMRNISSFSQRQGDLIFYTEKSKQGRLYFDQFL